MNTQRAACYSCPFFTFSAYYLQQLAVAALQQAELSGLQLLHVCFVSLQAQTPLHVQLVGHTQLALGALRSRVAPFTVSALMDVTATSAKAAATVRIILMFFISPS